MAVISPVEIRCQINVKLWLVIKRVFGEIGGRKMDDFHSGFSHTNYTSAIGIAKGIPTTDQTDAVRSWAAPFIPKPDVLERGIAVSGDS